MVALNERNHLTHGIVIETHPENLVDLRLGCAFKELLDYVDTFNLDELDQTDHAHVPFVVVLLTYLKDWKATVTLGSSCTDT